MSLQYPRKPYAVSDDIESFIHVYHYCVLRFHETAQTLSLASHIRAMYVEATRRAADGAYVGGSQKFANMCNSNPVIVPLKNVTLKDLLGDLAAICAAHYATIDTEEYEQLYDPAPQPSVSPAPEQENEPAPPYDRESNAKIRGWEAAVPAERHRAREPRIIPSPVLQDHRTLLRFFYQWGIGEEWPAKDLGRSSEDLFKKDHLAPSKNNAFGSSRSESSQVRASKRMKRNDGTSLASVSENVERIGSP